MKHRLFVYGTLMSGMPNNRWLDGCEMLGIARLKDYVLIDLGHYPGVIYQEDRGEDCDDDDVVGELWEVDDETLTQLDRIECVPNLYTRETTDSVYDENGYYRGVYLYVYNLNIILSGDWRAHAAQKKVAHELDDRD